MYQIIAFANLDKANEWLGLMGENIEVISITSNSTNPHEQYVICYRVL